MMPFRIVLAAALLAACPTAPALASGHGPLFGMATPTNPRDGWSVDFGAMGRRGDDDQGATFRAMIGYGLTEDLKLSVSVPLVFSSAALPAGRMAGMMPGSSDIETLVAWRFHRQPLGIGTRFESTAYGGLIVPGPQRPAGPAGDLTRAPGFFSGAVTGLASRSHYFWGGVGYTRFGTAEGDRRSDVLMYTAVWGYRPPALQKDYPHWDWRGMIEMTGERAGRMRHGGVTMRGTEAHQIFVGPSALGLYRSYGISFGVQFPVYRDLPSAQPRERFRYAINFSYFF